MSIFGRLRDKGAARSVRAPRANGASPPEARARVEVETFEYVRVGETALTRASGTLPPGTARPADFTLEVSVLGEGTERIRALVEAPQGQEDRWRAGFATRLDVVEHPAAQFLLLTGQGTIPLDPPGLRELHMAATPAPAEDLDQLESRVREAEAGLGWIQDQLHRERDRRRQVEAELEALRSELKAAADALERASERESQVAELEQRVAELTAERDRLAEEAGRRPREAEAQIEELTRLLEESRRATTVAQAQYSGARHEQRRMLAESQDAVAQLESALEAARSVREMTAAEPVALPEPEAAEGAMECTACDGSGSCTRCEGKGRRLGRQCATCGGTGGCRNCGGTGYMLEV